MAKKSSKRSSSARSQKKRSVKRFSKRKKFKKRASRSSQRVRPKTRRKKQIKIKRKKTKKAKRPSFQEKSLDLQVRKIKMKVIGIGGGGGSIISEIAPKLNKIKFLAANTDVQALKKSAKGIEKFQFGRSLTQGLGTGMNPEKGERAASAEIERIKKIFRGQDFSIIISCLGGGTGAGATSIFAKSARDLKNYTLGIFTLPFAFEGRKRLEIAENALEKIKPHLNAVIIFPNERIFQVISQKTALKEAFSIVNKILAEDIKGLIEMLFSPGLINIDFADLKTILSGKGALSFLNTVVVQGENRAEEGSKKILENPFYEYGITGADKILFNIAGGKDLKITEVEKISRSIADSNRMAKIIFGISENEKYRGKIKITLLAVGCGKKPKISIHKVKRKTSKIKEIVTIIPSKPEIKKRKAKSKKKKMKSKPRRPQSKVSIQPVPKKKTIENKDSDKNSTSSPERKAETTTRRNALDLKRDTEKIEKEYLKYDAEWDVPAFLRRGKKA